jgi:hypothetical protein
VDITTISTCAFITVYITCNVREITDVQRSGDDMDIHEILRRPDKQTEGTSTEY